MTRLVVFGQTAFHRTEAGVQSAGAFLTQMRALRPHFERVILCNRYDDAPGFEGEPVDGDEFELRELPPYRGRWDFLRQVGAYREGILAALRDADLALVVLPGYVGSLASGLCQRAGVRTFHWVVGDWGNVALARRPEMPARLWAWCARPALQLLVRRLTRDTLTFWGGRIPTTPAPAHHHVRTSSSIARGDLAPPGCRACPSDPPRLLFVGRLSAEKGVAGLIEAVAILAQRGRRVHLEVAGMGELRAALEACARSHGVASQVTFHGYVQRGKPLRRLYDGATLFVLPSLEDMQPRVLLEAMARELAIVATDVGEVRSVLRDRVNGLLVPPGDPGAIAAAVEALLDDPALAGSLASAGRLHAEQHTVERETEDMMRVLERHFALS